MQNTCGSCLRVRNERMHINTCVNTLQVQALESCPSSDVTPSVVLPALDLVPYLVENLKSVSLANA